MPTTYTVESLDKKFADVANQIPPSGVAVVKHEEDPNVARPDAKLVWWIGSVEPLNALEDDAWTQKPSGGSVEPDAAPTVGMP